MQKIGRYQLLEELGSGSFATVFRALDTRLERQIALKVLDPLLGRQDEFIQMFLAEARSAASLKHPNIVTIHDYEETGGQLLIAMELVEGRDLRKLIRSGGPLPIEQVVDIIEQAASALAYAHQRGLVHRDVKAANILLEGGTHAVLTDFGLAKAIAGSVYARSFSGSRGIAGTVEYLAPEQAEGEAATPQSDLYALGIVAYELLTGRVPFKAESPLVVMRMQADKPPPDPAELRPDLPAGMRAALLKALSKDPAERQEGVLAFAADLRQSTNDNQPSKILTLAPGVELELVRVPAGRFMMGSDKAVDKDAYDDELPQHELHLDEYWIGKTPVTVAQFAAFVKAASYQTSAEKEGSGYTWTGKTWDYVKGADWAHPRGPKSDVRQKQDHPVTLVSWKDAAAFCEWASRSTGQQVRLPSEAEWEKAARGGLPSPRVGRGAGGEGGVRLYPWGNAPPDKTLCNFNMNVKDTTPVGKYSPGGDSPYGCADMAGNVWEWTRSLWKSYPYDPKDGREDPDSRDMRVLRGGSFYNPPRLVRCAYRCGSYPGFRIANLGFRVVAFHIFPFPAGNAVWLRLGRRGLKMAQPAPWPRGRKFAPGRIGKSPAPWASSLGQGAPMRLFIGNSSTCLGETFLEHDRPQHLGR